jgi:hypothetical protein
MRFPFLAVLSEATRASYGVVHGYGMLEADGCVSDYLLGHDIGRLTPIGKVTSSFCHDRQISRSFDVFRINPR